MEQRWSEEQLFFDGDAFFDALAQSISTAKTAIDLEMYIFEYDSLGRRFVDLLNAAAARGVAVRVIVDSIGSANSKDQLRQAFSGSGVQFDVYHQLPWERAPQTMSKRSSRVFAILRQLNKRNHRKVFLIDHEVAWLGGMNLWEVQLRSIKGDEAWRDSAIAVRGADIVYLERAFAKVWSRRNLRRRLRWPLARSPLPPLVRLNDSRRLRRKNFVDLLRRIRLAERRIWITTPYFVPLRALRRALQRAASRGVDLRILLADQSDVVFIPWVSWVLYRPLLKSGVRVFRYVPAILHAKSIIIDDWMTLGSSNMNHRSFIHDLEVDAVVTRPESQQLLAAQFLADVSQSEEVLRSDEPILSWWQRLVGQFAFYFRYWL